MLLLPPQLPRVTFLEGETDLVAEREMKTTFHPVSKDIFGTWAIPVLETWKKPGRGIYENLGAKLALF
jgi:hypothetical protein